MQKTTLLAAAAAASLAFAGSAYAAGVTTVNGTPNAGNFYGTGNNYSPADDLLLTMQNGDQIFLRFHQTFQPAPASDGSGVYDFNPGPTFLSVDWGVDATGTGSLAGVGAMMTLTSSVGSVSFDLFAPGNDNSVSGNVSENSLRENWFPQIAYDPLRRDLYSASLGVTGLAGGPETLTGFARVGGVPEPATWAMMLLGCAGAGALLRRSRQLAAA